MSKMDAFILVILLYVDMLRYFLRFSIFGFLLSLLGVQELPEVLEFPVEINE